ncbi:MAG: dihydrodipicolinate synthase family protein [Verrucomicrobia bacterium]|nr:dihydrodipicolinate synthase family protein [Verrucomicrobiota bacterium]MDA1068839.1 dihydrodipicolinate synthase family protein [Verrucomicrobiota bacterium]
MTIPRFKGIIPPLITPLKDRDSLDHDGLERLIEHVIAGGVHGLFALGTTGEGPSLSYRLRTEVIQKVCNTVSGRIPVFISVTDTSFVESVRLSQVAADSGADAVVLATPYYFPADQEELIRYVEHIVSELALPVMLYNMPSLTKVWFEIETVKALTSIERILGVKDSGGNLEYYSRLCKLRAERPDWSFFIGPEELMIQSISLGGNGGVNGGANAYPQLFVKAYESAVSGDSRQCAELQEKIQAFGKIYDIGKNSSRYIKTTKCAASILGLCDDFMAEPFIRLDKNDREKLRGLLNKLEL